MLRRRDGALPRDGAHRAVSFLGPDDGNHGNSACTRRWRRARGCRDEIKSAHVVDGVRFERMAILLASLLLRLTVERVLRTFEIPCQAFPPTASAPARRASVLDLCRLALLEERSASLQGGHVLADVWLHPYRVRELDREARMSRNTTLEALIDERSARMCSSSGECVMPRAKPQRAGHRHVPQRLETSKWYPIRFAPAASTPKPPRTSMPSTPSAGPCPTSSRGSPAQPCSTTSKRRPIRRSPWARAESPIRIRAFVDVLPRRQGPEWDVVCVTRRRRGTDTESPSRAGTVRSLGPRAWRRDRACAGAAGRGATNPLCSPHSRTAAAAGDDITWRSEGDAVPVLRGGIGVLPTRSHRARTNLL